VKDSAESFNSFAHDEKHHTGTLPSALCLSASENNFFCLYSENQGKAVGLIKTYSPFFKYKLLHTADKSEKCRQDNGEETIISSRKHCTILIQCSPISQQSIFLG